MSRQSKVVGPVHHLPRPLHLSVLRLSFLSVVVSIPRLSRLRSSADTSRTVPDYVRCSVLRYRLFSLVRPVRFLVGVLAARLHVYHQFEKSGSPQYRVLPPGKQRPTLFLVQPVLRRPMLVGLTVRLFRTLRSRRGRITGFTHRLRVHRHVRLRPLLFL